ncbi:hypothetical protein GCM10027446_34110 [Angustibacter peucedani]
MADGEQRQWLGARVYAFLFRFLGPAQLGSQQQPPTGQPDPQFACPVCGHPMAEHTWVEDAGRRRMYCPAPPLG